MTLKSGFGSFKVIESDTIRKLGTVSYSRSTCVVTMALSSTSSEIKRDIGRKSRFIDHTPPFDASVREGGPRRNVAMVWLLDGRKSSVTCSAISTQYRRVCDRRADGRTDRHLAYHRAVNIEQDADVAGVTTVDGANSRRRVRLKAGAPLTQIS